MIRCSNLQKQITLSGNCNLASFMPVARPPIILTNRFNYNWTTGRLVEKSEN